MCGIGIAGFRYFCYNIVEVGKMESIESALDEAIRLLEIEDFTGCKNYLKKAKEIFRKANTDEEMKYLKELESSLK